MFPVAQEPSGPQRRLLQLFRALDGADQASLLAFAEFLTSRGKGEPSAGPNPEPLHAPREIPRPGQENVVAAIRRLSETFFMLERGRMLNETSLLMSSHILQGRAAPEVIDDLESLFQRHYRDYRNQD
ncbi:MAG: hypothetical protein KJ558_08275 [Gammaproteobacteria bacterium]|nr:hypothetical protein [Gammaproteobacteria bacterium]MBU1654809.1 hypothetical protein [Gammaproteobacteria bacterium]MBU1960550.1 hypothetical protein [Gammaproteobacteria bacterium]